MLYIAHEQAFSGQMSQPQSQPQQQSLATLGSPGPASRALTGPAPTATGGAVGGADFGAGPGLSNGFEATAFRGTPDGWDQAFGHTPSLQLQVGKICRLTRTCMLTRALVGIDMDCKGVSQFVLLCDAAGRRILFDSVSNLTCSWMHLHASPHRKPWQRDGGQPSRSQRSH